jgi:hypothetical protein
MTSYSKRLEKMDSPPELIYRRLNFPHGIPPEYRWAAASTPHLLETGGAGIQRMTFDTWRELIQREQSSGTGHIGPTGVGNLPRGWMTPRFSAGGRRKESGRGGCGCPVCSHNYEILSANNGTRDTPD